LKPISGNPIKDSNYSNRTEPLGGKSQKWKIESKLGENLLIAQPQQLGEETVKQAYEIGKILNVDESRSYIDDSKLIISLHVDRAKYETQEELYQAIRNRWVDTKGRSQITVTDRIHQRRRKRKLKLCQDRNLSID